MDRGAEKTAVCIVGLLFGAGLVLRWVRRRIRKGEMNRLRKIKQKERQIALENMEQLAKSSQVTNPSFSVSYSIGPVRSSYASGYNILKVQEHTSAQNINFCTTCTP